MYKDVSSPNKTYSGISLIEVLLVVSLLTLIAAFSIPLTINAIGSNDLATSKAKLVEALRVSNRYARANREDDSWGVRIESDQIIIFKGNDFNSRDSSFDESFPKSSEISVSGGNELYFQKVSGTPSATTTITLTNQEGSNSNISINSAGLIDGD